MKKLLKYFVEQTDKNIIALLRGQSSNAKKYIFTISEAAEFLGVSADTLRNWETSGKITSQRTKGGARRFTLAQLNQLVSQTGNKYKVINNISKSNTIEQFHNIFELEVSPRRWNGVKLITTAGLGVLAVGSLVFLALIIRPMANTEVSQDANVLGISDEELESSLDINIPTNINADLTVKGKVVADELTALNLNTIFSLTAGDGISVTSSQKPTIKNTGVLSLQSKTGALTFTEGTDITIDGLKITNKSDLSTVRGRGGCSSCITDADVVAGLTISGGSVNDSAIGATTASTGAFTTLSASSTLAVTGATTLSSTLSVSGATTLNGNVTLGDASSDTITFTGRVASNIVPTTSDTYTLGTSSLPWSQLYLSGVSTLGGQSTFTASPTGTAVGNGSIYINPASVSNSSYTLFGIAVGGTEKLRMDADGNITVQGNLLGPSGGSIGYWSRSSTNVRPYTMTDNIVTYGNIGIGSTASPATNLHLLGSGTGTGVQLLTQNSAQTNFGLSVLDNGNVGIGTTGPGYKLDVLGTGRFTSNLDVNGNVTSNNYVLGSSWGGLTWGYLRMAYGLRITDNGIPMNNSQNNGLLNVSGGVNQSGSIGYTAFKLNVTETSIGSGPNRLMDLQVGGSSKFVIDNTGNVGIGFTSPAALLDVMGTTLLRGSSSTTGLAVTAAGNVGVGTTSPLANLHVVGQCVTGDTLLKRRRRKRRTMDDGEIEDGDLKMEDGEWKEDNLSSTLNLQNTTLHPLPSTVNSDNYIYDEVRIDQIQPGDEILTLDEGSGEFVYQRVNNLMDMGKQEVFKLITQHGKIIETTDNHPYLTVEGIRKLKDKQRSYTFEVDQSPRIEDLTKDSVLALANREQGFVLTLPKKAKRQIISEYKRQNRIRQFAPEVFALMIVMAINKSGFKIGSLIIDSEYKTYEKTIAEIIEKAYPFITIQIKSVGRVNSPAHKLAYSFFTKKGIKKAGSLPARISKDTVLQSSITPGLTQKIREPKLPSHLSNYNTKWVKVKYLKPGMIIATIDGWEKIAAKYSTGKKQTFDIEVENTHNFVGNDIVAHNTYLNGNLGLGIASPQTKLHLLGSGTGTGVQLLTQNNTQTNFGLSVLDNGNVGIGTTGPNYKLHVNGSFDLAGKSGVSGGNVYTDGTGLFLEGSYSGKIEIGSAATGGGRMLFVAQATDGLNGEFFFGASGSGTGAKIVAGADLNFGTGGYSQAVPGTIQMVIKNTTGNVGIGFTSPAALLDVMGTTLLRGSSTTTGLAVTAAGNVGVGTTSPLANLHVVGQCVAEGTLIKRRRRRRKTMDDGEIEDGDLKIEDRKVDKNNLSSTLNPQNTTIHPLPSIVGDYIYEDIPVEGILPGDEVLSLNDATGDWEWHKVEKTMNMGIQEVFKIYTRSGLSIETTENHPYLVRMKAGKPETLPLGGTFEVDQSPKIEQMTKDSFIAIASTAYPDQAYVLKIRKGVKRQLLNQFKSKKTKNFAPMLFGRSIALLIKLARISPDRLIIDKDFPGYNSLVEEMIIQSLPKVSIEFKSVGKNSPAHIAAFSFVSKKEEHKKTTVIPFEGTIAALHPEFHRDWPVVEADFGVSPKGSSLPAHGLFSSLYHKRQGLSRKDTAWTKVAQLKPGMIIATLRGWEPIRTIHSTNRKLTYDLQIANTHNFVGNNIVAHNTYLNGNLGLGIQAPSSKLQILGDGTGTGVQLLTQNNTQTNFGLSVLDNGNVGIGTTAPSVQFQVGSTNYGGNTDIYVRDGSSSDLRVRYDDTYINSINERSMNVANNDFILSTSGGVSNREMIFKPRSTEAMRISGVGNVGIGFTSPAAKLDVMGTALLRGSSTTTGLAVTAAGNVGVGTTSPLANLHVVGQCVTGDTLLKRRRRKRRTMDDGEIEDGDLKMEDGEWKEDNLSSTLNLQNTTLHPLPSTVNSDNYIYDEVRIDQIQPGDEILTLDESTGRFITSKVKGLMDMGKKDIIKITTASGKSIRTTSEHPYLIRKEEKNQEEDFNTNILYHHSFEHIQNIAESFYKEVLEGESVKVPSLGNAEVYFSREGWNHLVEEKKSRFEVMARFFGLPKILPLLLLAKDASYEKSRSEPGTYFWALQGIVEGVWVKVIIRKTKDKPKHFYSIIWKGEEHRSEVKNAIKKGAVSRLYPRRQAWDKSLTFSTFNWNKYTTFVNKLQVTHLPGEKNALHLEGGGKWIKVKDLQIGAEIATIDGWEEITTIEHLPREQVFDIEVANTHNFVGNNIVAHNTYITGNLGLGIASPQTKLHLLGSGTGTGVNLLTQNNTQTNFGLSVLDNGNVGIGTSAPGGTLAVTSSNTTGTTTSSAFSFSTNSLTTGTGLYLASSTITTGTLFSLASTSTVFSSGYLFNLDWSPTSSVTASGDLFRINIGSNGTTTGNLFDIEDNTSSLFSVSEAQIVSSLPHSFTAPGDVSIAYDIVFTNPTSSFIKSQGPLVLSAGEVYNSSNLTLQTFNSGKLVFDLPGGVSFNQQQSWRLPSSTWALDFQNTSGTQILNFDSTNARVGIGTTGPVAMFNIASTTAVDLFRVDDNGRGDTSPFVIDQSGNVGIANSAPSFNLDVVGTGRLSSNLAVGGAGLIGFTTTATAPSSGLAVSGNVGVGTTSPLQALHVVGQCVVGETKLKRRRRRKGKNGQWIDEWEEVPIKDIKAGDEILTLDETSGEFVVQKVEKLLDMGIKEIYQLTTATGKIISTTSNHPYLVAPKINSGKVAIFVDAANFEISAKLNHLTFDYKDIIKTFFPNKEKVDFRYYTVDFETSGQRRFLGYLDILGSQIVTKAAKVIKESGKLDEHKANFDVEISVDAALTKDSFDTMVLFSGDSDFTYLVTKLQELGKRVVVISPWRTTARELRKAADLYLDLYHMPFVDNRKRPRRASQNRFLDGMPILQQVYPFVKKGKWTKVSGLRAGQMIATVGENGKPVFEKVVSIKKTKAEQVFDIEVEGTHNFVGNNIVAHNTYITGNVGLGIASPQTKLHLLGSGTGTGVQLLTQNSTQTNFGLSVLDNGNVGIGTTAPGGTLAVTSSNTTGTTTSSAFSFSTNSLTTGTGLYLASSTITTGTLFSLASTSTVFSSGYLFNLDWSPTSSVTASGDLFRINIGSNGTTTGNLFDIEDNTSSLFSVSEAQIVSSLPHSFTAPGDVSIAYDLTFTNPTASYIKSQGPLYLTAGEVFGSSDLTLQTYNLGDIVLDSPGGVTLNQQQTWTLANTSTWAWDIQNSSGTQIMNFDTTNARVGIGRTNPGSTLGVNGNTILGASFIGSAAPSNGLAIQGNVGIGATTANSNLVVVGNANIGSAYSGVTAPSNGLLVQGNVGIGTTGLGGNGNFNLDVWGTARITGALTLNGNLTNSATFLASDGSAAAPSYSFSSDTDTGLYRYAANSLALVTGGIGSQTLSLNSSGNVGVGTTSPLANLHVVGQCVAEGTLIKRRRRRRKTMDDGEIEDGDLKIEDRKVDKNNLSSTLNPQNTTIHPLPSIVGDYIYEDIPVEDIKSGDEVLSLNDKTGNWEWNKVEATLNKGTQTVYRLETEGGKWIETTSEHPYLVKEEENRKTQKTRLSADSLTNSTIDTYAFGLSANSVPQNLNFVKSDSGPEGNRTPATRIDSPKAVPTAGPLVSLSQNTNLPSISKWLKVFQIKAGMEVATFPSSVIARSGNDHDVAIHKTDSHGRQGDLGMTIQWEKIVSITKIGRKLTYDLQIKNTHNFVGNNIVAHNTYITGNVGLGANFTGATIPSNGLAIQGNLGIGTTTANNPLSVVGAASIGSSFYSVSAPSNGLLVEGNVGIGTSLPTDKLHVIGRLNLALASTGNNIAIGPNTLPSVTTASSLIAIGKDIYTTVTTGAADGIIIGNNVGNSTFNPNLRVRNIYLGDSVANANEGYDNINIGHYSMGNNNYRSIFIGNYVGQTYARATDSVLIGYQVNNTGVTLTNDVAVGAYSMYNAADGSSTANNNVAIGYRSLAQLRVGSNNVAIGYRAADYGSTDTFSNKLYIGNDNSASATLLYGSFVADSVFGNKKFIGPGDGSTTNLGYVGYTWSNVYTDALTSGLGLFSGNVGIGTSVSLTVNPLSVFGGVGIGNSGPNGFSNSLAPSLGLAVQGNVGVGTTSPLANLHVVGQCVTGDTLLKRRRRKRRTMDDGEIEDGDLKMEDGEWKEDNLSSTLNLQNTTLHPLPSTVNSDNYIYDEVRIDQIQPGDEILTLDETSGEFISSKVKGLMDMGIQQTYLLITDKGKTIRTTANHPYFIKETKKASIMGGVYQVDQSPRIETLTQDSFIAIANSNIRLVVKIDKQTKRKLHEMYQALGEGKFFAPDLLVFGIRVLLNFANIHPTRVQIDNEYPGYENRIRQFIKASNPDVDIEVKSIGHGKKAYAHWASYLSYKGKEEVDFEFTNKKDRGILQRRGQGTVTLVPLNQIRSTRGLIRQDYHKLEDLSTHSINSGLILSLPNVSNAKWRKVYDIKPGMEVATVDGWEKVVALKEYSREQVFDIEVENTHNFVGNDIVAHNTYITGNVGLGIASPATNLHLLGSGTGTGVQLLTQNNTQTNFGLAVLDNGNVGIGTTGPDYQLVATKGGNTFKWIDAGPYIRVDDGTRQIGMGTDSTNKGWIGSISNDGLGFRTNNAVKMWISTDGNVGIGTNTPGSALSVIGNVGIGTSAAGAALQVNGGGLFGWGTASSALSSGAILGVNGNVGVGTTSPLANLHVVGQCVAEGTLIKRRRRRRKTMDDGEIEDGDLKIEDRKVDKNNLSSTLNPQNTTIHPLPSIVGDYIYEDIPVEDIRPDDEVLSLNDQTGDWEWHEVEQTMDKGIQTVYRLETEGGKWIETTSEHPYLVREAKLAARLGRDGEKWLKVFQIKAGMEVATSDGWEKIVSINKVGRKLTYDLQIANTHNFVGGHYINRKTGQALTEEQEAAYVEYLNQQKTRLSASSLTDSTVDTYAARLSKKSITQDGPIVNFESGPEGNRTPASRIESPAAVPTAGPLVSLSQILRMEVKETLDTSKVGFDSFEVELGFDPDDIEYGGIVAHNTYLNGNLGLGIQAPSSKLQILGDGTGTGVQLLTQNNTQTNFGLAVLDNGNVGIGTTAPTGVFQVGSSATAPVLFASSLTGNVGIGTTNPGTALDVVGTGRFSSTLTASNGLTVSAGQLLVPDGTDAIPGIGFTDANTGFRGRVNAGIVAIIDGVQHAYFGNSTLTLATTDALSWASGQYTDSATDLSIFRDAANVLAQRRSTNAQEFRIYNSDSTSDEFASLGFINNSNVFTIETEQVGGGTVLPIALMGGNVGIGFTSPAALLDVMGTALLRGSSTTTGLAVTAAGNVGVGTTSPSAPFEVKAAGTGAIAKFTSDNSTGCTLADGGTITCSSDLSLKKNITGLSYGLSDLLKLNPVEFNWKIDEDGSLKNLGFIAQEVETVLPKLVITGEAGLKELNTIGLVPLLTKSIQQIEGRLKGLEEKIASDSVQFIASSSASLNLTPPDILLATGSAKLKDLQVFSEATVSGMLAAYELKVSDSLKSLGLTTLAKTNVAGDLIIDGTLSITGNSISSLETLKLQGGKVTIDNQGNLTVQKLIVSSKTLGTAVIPAKQQQLLVKGQITSSSKVFLTPERPAVLGVSKDPLTQTFTILLEKVQDKELKVDWWIVDSEE